jgi:hypothetical protein
MGRVVRTLREQFSRGGEMQHGWNAFQQPVEDFGWQHGPSMPHSSRGYSGGSSRIYSDKSMIAAIKLRIAVDVAMVEFYHAMTDPQSGTPLSKVLDSLNERLTLSANIDQTAFAFKVDMVLTMFDAGDVAVCPIDTSVNPNDTASFDIGSLRVGTISTYYPRSVMCNVYDDREVDSRTKQPVNGGIRKDVHFTKEQVAIVENPLYTVMNAPNGRLQRLLRNMELLGQLNENLGSGKLDLLVQLPVQVRGEKRSAEAEKRRQTLRDQLKDDELGIGYIDITEKVIQLNRPINNTLPDQIDRDMAYVMSELGITQKVMDGSASGDELNTYMDRTIEPICAAFQLEFKRKFLTANARGRGHSIETYKNPLKFIPLEKLGETVDHLLRNAAVTVNEIRPIIGFFPSSDPKANELVNPNMPADKQATGAVNADPAALPASGQPDELDAELDSAMAEIDGILGELSGGS